MVDPVKICEICAKVFKSRTNYYVHTYHNHIDPAKRKVKIRTCEICNKNFTSCVSIGKLEGVCALKISFQDGFKRHMARHAGTLIRLRCEICPNKAFFSVVSKEKHMDAHNAKGKLTCAICDKTFALRQFLKDHMRAQHIVAD